jgi:hypothetical protein
VVLFTSRTHHRDHCPSSPASHQPRCHSCSGRVVVSALPASPSRPRHPNLDGSTVVFAIITPSPCHNHTLSTSLSSALHLCHQTIIVYLTSPSQPRQHYNCGCITSASLSSSAPPSVVVVRPGHVIIPTSPASLFGTSILFIVVRPSFTFLDRH